MEQKAEKDEKITELNQEISEFQLQNLEIPDQLKNLEDHLVVMNQEKRKLEKEYRAIMETLQR
jgi:uncharacterized protein (DUF3084 family)